MISHSIPFGIFPGWNTEKFAENSARLGFPTWLKWRLFNSTIVFIPAILFAYSIIYFVLPRYYFERKKPVIAAFMFAGIFILVFSFHYFASWLVEWNNHRINPARAVPEHYRRMSLVTKAVLFNYPIYAGMAVIIKMMKRDWLKQQETQQIAREKAKAELQLLKAQIHPHFLFNTINNIYFFTLTASPKAPEMLMKLADILQYIINECSRSLVPLGKELKMIEDYMALEKIRYGDRLKMEVEIKGEYISKMISPLLLIPLVENSFKHGASKMLQHPWVNLDITINDQYLYFLLSNSRPDEIPLQQHFGHIGLNNVKKRLQLLYPGAHEMSIVNSPRSFEVFLKIGLTETNSMDDETNLKKENSDYAMA